MLRRGIGRRCTRAGRGAASSERRAEVGDSAPRIDHRARRQQDTWRATRAAQVLRFIFTKGLSMSAIESVLQERRVFPPSAEAAAGATISGMDAYRALVAEAERDYEGFWGRLARETLSWNTPFTKVLDEAKAPFYT
jgi:acetyl-CoA synthetase